MDSLHDGFRVSASAASFLHIALQLVPADRSSTAQLARKPSTAEAGAGATTAGTEAAGAGVDRPTPGRCVQLAGHGEGAGAGRPPSRSFAPRGWARPAPCLAL